MTTSDHYKNGKIYKLVNDVDDAIYVGSTCLTLPKRMYNHKQAANRPATKRRVYMRLNAVGWEHVHIILIETYQCETKQALLSRERHWIDELHPTLNMVLPITTEEETKQRKHRWEEKHREERNEYKKQWEEKHKQERNEYKKQWEEKHKEERNEYKKQWAEKHREERQQYMKAYSERRKRNQKMRSPLQAVIRFIDEDAGRR